MNAPFLNRQDAGRRLAIQLEDYADRSDALVLGLPRGGVPVAFEVAERLDLPLDVFVVRKLGVPGQEELAMGAIASGGVCVLDRELIRRLGVTPEQIDAVAKQETAELERRERRYRDELPPPDVEDRVVILVDDGLATGATMRAAAEALRQLGPKRIVVAVPIAAKSTCDAFRDQVDETICLVTPEQFYAVGLWYDDFTPTTDEEVRDLLAKRGPLGAREPLLHRRG
jgi:predicted phosphoribosyltransferase